MLHVADVKRFSGTLNGMIFFFDIPRNVNIDTIAFIKVSLQSINNAKNESMQHLLCFNVRQSSKNDNIL